MGLDTLWRAGGGADAGVVLAGALPPVQTPPSERDTVEGGTAVSQRDSCTVADNQHSIEDDDMKQRPVWEGVYVYAATDDDDSG